MNVNDWPLYRYRGTVERIIDGDTAQILLDLGDRTYRSRRIRILGYDAPEMVGASRAEGMAAKDALEAIAPIGSRVYIATKLDRTSFDRLLGYLFVEGQDGTLDDVSQLMIGAGFDVSKETA